MAHAGRMFDHESKLSIVTMSSQAGDVRWCLLHFREGLRSSVPRAWLGPLHPSFTFCSQGTMKEVQLTYRNVDGFLFLKPALPSRPPGSFGGEHWSLHRAHCIIHP